MASKRHIESATLTETERATIEQFVELLDRHRGGRLVSAWLYGSRARGERPHPESDVDLMVVTRRGADDADRVYELLFDAAGSHGANAFMFSVQVVAPEWLADRRRIESFFIQEVDRDKVVLAGER